MIVGGGRGGPWRIESKFMFENKKIMCLSVCWIVIVHDNSGTDIQCSHIYMVYVSRIEKLE